MQLGVRWRAGDPPHISVPSVLHEEIATQELRFSEASSWTLTWLEGRPRCDLDDFVAVRLTAAGKIVASSPDAIFDGVGYSTDSIARDGAGRTSGDDLLNSDDDDDDDDDDWLM